MKREDGTPTDKALALAVDCNPRFCFLDPHLGTNQEFIDLVRENGIEAVEDCALIMLNTGEY